MTSGGKLKNLRYGPWFDAKTTVEAFYISLDELISDKDVEKQKLCDKKLFTKTYLSAVACFGATVLFPLRHLFINCTLCIEFN